MSLDDKGFSDVMLDIDKELDIHGKLSRQKKRRAYRAQWQQKRRSVLKKSQPGFDVDTPFYTPCPLPDYNLVFKDECSSNNLADIDLQTSVPAVNEREANVGHNDPGTGFDEDDRIAVERIHDLEELLEHVKLEGVPDTSEMIYDNLDVVGDLMSIEDLKITGHQGPGSLWADLRNVANQTNMNTTQIDSVLKCLKSHPESVTAVLPKSYKTLFGAEKLPVKDRIRKLSGHDYYYIDLADQIKFCLDKYPKEVVDSVDVLDIIWNNDGLPLYNSRKVASWPVLCYIANLKPRIVFEVVLTAGQGKPTDTTYLEEFVNDLGKLMDEGLFYSGKLYAVLHKAGVCDAPARAQVKNTKQFSAKVGCDMCNAVGKYDGKRVVWVGVDTGTPRTNSTFRQKDQLEYHLQNGRESPFLKIDVDMVKQFPPDFMHQGGGTMKKVLLWLTQGPKMSENKKYNIRLTARNIQILDDRIKYIMPFMPNFFNRRLRTTAEVRDYKYTELRQFLLYSGKLLLLDITSSHEIYAHFLMYSIACCLMVDEEKAVAYYGVHRAMMKRVVAGFSDLYSESIMTYNVHVQQHLPEMAAIHGGLDVVSAYPFENHLGMIKRYVTSSHNPLISIIKGVERRKANMSGRQFKQPKNPIYVKEPNNIYVNHRNHKVYEALLECQGQVKLKEYLRIDPFFEDPLPSYVIGCYLLRIDSFRYLYLPIENVQQMRRGFKVNLDNFPGLYDPRLTTGRAVCFTAMHSLSNSLF